MRKGVAFRAKHTACLRSRLKCNEMFTFELISKRLKALCEMEALIKCRYCFFFGQANNSLDASAPHTERRMQMLGCKANEMQSNVHKIYSPIAYDNDETHLRFFHDANL